MKWRSVLLVCQKQGTIWSTPVQMFLQISRVNKLPISELIRSHDNTGETTKMYLHHFFSVGTGQNRCRTATSWVAENAQQWNRTTFRKGIKFINIKENLSRIFCNSLLLLLAFRHISGCEWTQMSEIIYYKMFTLLFQTNERLKSIEKEYSERAKKSAEVSYYLELCQTVWLQPFSCKYN